MALDGHFQMLVQAQMAVERMQLFIEQRAPTAHQEVAAYF
jgi:hypothetical protein